MPLFTKSSGLPARAMPRRQQTGRKSDQKVLWTDSRGERQQYGADEIGIGIAASAKKKSDGEDDEDERGNVAEGAAAEEPDVRKEGAERAGNRRTW